MTAIPITLVCGPPAAGKSTWVRSRAGPGDRVIDLDEICRELGSRSSHDHPRRLVQLAKSMRASLEQNSASRPGRTFAIRCLPRPEDRAAVAERLGADVVMIATSADTAIERAQADGRPDWTAQAIRDWWAIYQPHPADRPAT